MLGGGFPKVHKKVFTRHSEAFVKALEELKEQRRQGNLLLKDYRKQCVDWRALINATT